MARGDPPGYADFVEKANFTKKMLDAAQGRLLK
jgi:hypothetical protein